MNDGTKGMVIQGTHCPPPPPRKKKRKAVIRCKSSTLVASKTGPSPEPSIWIAGLRWRFELFVLSLRQDEMFWARIRCDELDGKKVLPFGAGIFVPAFICLLFFLHSSNKCSLKHDLYDTKGRLRGL